MRTFQVAAQLINTHGDRGLRTLDALQVAACLRAQSTLFVTADGKLAGVARAAGLDAVEFGGATSPLPT